MSATAIATATFTQVGMNVVVQPRITISPIGPTPPFVGFRMTRRARRVAHLFAPGAFLILFPFNVSKQRHWSPAVKANEQQCMIDSDLFAHRFS